MPKMYVDGEFQKPFYVESLGLHIQDLRCDKGNQVYLKRSSGDDTQLIMFDADCLEVNENGDLIINLDMYELGPVPSFEEVEWLGDYNKFTPEQTRWIEALESGEWKQGKCYLKRKEGGEDHYCCLGVATALFNPQSSDLRIKQGEKRSVGVEAPYSVVKTLMLHNEVGSNLDGSEDLALMNDDLGYTFEDIAKFIREKPCEVFYNFDKDYKP